MGNKDSAAGQVGAAQLAPVTHIDLGGGEPIARPQHYAPIIDLLGGPEVLKREVHSTLDVHRMTVTGLGAAALLFLLKAGDLAKQDVAPAVGMSARTVHRLSADKTLTSEQSGRVWRFAETLAQATEVFGTRAEAERWLTRPAIGLNQEVPIELMTTLAGTDIVAQFLVRLEYGVYT